MPLQVTSQVREGSGTVRGSSLPALLHLWVFPQGHQNKPASLPAADDCHFCLPRVGTHHHNCHQGALVQGAKKSSPSQWFVAPQSAQVDDQTHSILVGLEFHRVPSIWKTG